jgi:hypothetical protein
MGIEAVTSRGIIAWSVLDNLANSFPAVHTNIVTSTVIILRIKQLEA